MADEHKGFANLHYPGIYSDPNEGRKVLDSGAHWKLEAQIACLGEAEQEKLLSSSVFIIGATPLGVAIARKLLLAGVGRVGVFRDEPLKGAHALGVPEDSTSTALPALSKWAAAEAPWAELERFRGATIDRALDDMARGFQFIVSAVGAEEAGQALVCARATAGEKSMLVVAAHVAGKSAWCAAIPRGAACESCLEVPESGADSAGLYFPLLDFAAGWVAALVTEAALGLTPSVGFVESIDAKRVPWARETLPVEGCEKCRLAK